VASIEDKNGFATGTFLPVDHLIAAKNYFSAATPASESKSPCEPVPPLTPIAPITLPSTISGLPTVSRVVGTPRPP
jgi:hypothetical protein